MKQAGCVTPLNRAKGGGFDNISLETHWIRLIFNSCSTLLSDELSKEQCMKESGKSPDILKQNTKQVVWEATTVKQVLVSIKPRKKNISNVVQNEWYMHELGHRFKIDRPPVQRVFTCWQCVYCCILWNEFSLCFPIA